MAGKYKPKAKKPSAVAKLKSKAWTLYYKAYDMITDIRIVLLHHVPKPPDEKEIQKRIANMGLDHHHSEQMSQKSEAVQKAREEKDLRARREKKDDSFKKKYPKWLFSPKSMSLYQRVLQVVNVLFFVAGICALCFGVDLQMGLGYTFEGTHSEGGVYEIYSKNFGLGIMIVSIFCLLLTAAAIYGGRLVVPSGDYKADVRTQALRKKVLQKGYVYPVSFILFMLLVACSMAYIVTTNDAFAEQFMRDYIQPFYESSEPTVQAASHRTFACCLWEFPASSDKLRDLVEIGTCPEEAELGCRVKFKMELIAMLEPMAYAFFGLSGLVSLCIFFAMAIVTHQIKDDSDAQFVFHRGGGGFGLFEPVSGNPAGNTEDFAQQMKEVMKDKKAEEDMQSDYEEHERFIEKYNDQYQKGVKAQTKAQKGGKGKGAKGAKAKSKAGKKKKHGGKSLLETAYEKIAAKSRDKLKKMEEVEKEEEEAEEDVMPAVGPKYPWWILHLNYLVCFMFIGFTEYFCFVFFMNMRPITTQLALQTFLQAEISQILVYEPGSIFAKAIVLPFVLGTLAGTSFGRLADMAADIGLGAASGIGAVGFADRMLNQRRENAAVKAQAAFRGVAGRRLAGKLKQKTDATVEERKMKRDRLKETSKLKGKRVSLFKMASAIAKEKASEERETVRDSLNGEISRRQLRPARKRNLPVRKGMGERDQGPNSPMSKTGSQRRKPRGNAVRPAQFQRRLPGSDVGPPTPGGQGSKSTEARAPMSGTVALSKALNKDQSFKRKPKGAKGRRKILRAQGEKE